MACLRKRKHERRRGRACTEETCDRYAAGDADGIALNIVSRGIVGTDPAFVLRTSRTSPSPLPLPVTIRTSSRTADLRILASRPSRVAPVASSRDSACSQHDVVLFKWTRKREIKNKLPSCKSVPILSRAIPLSRVYI